MKSPWKKNPKSNRIAKVVSHNHSMTGGNSLQCRMVQVGVSHVQLGGGLIIMAPQLGPGYVSPRQHSSTPYFSLVTHSTNLVLFFLIDPPSSLANNAERKLQLPGEFLYSKLETNQIINKD
jgi:hypothetical protein